MNTYFLEFHNWNLHLTYLSFADMFIFCLFWKGGGGEGRFIVACWKWVLFFFLFLSIANKVKIEKLYCVKKKRKKEYNKVSAYACFLKKKIKQKEIEHLKTLAVEACFEIYCALVNIYWKRITAYFQLTPWCSMPSFFVIEAFNYLWWMRNEIFNLRL